MTNQLRRFAHVITFSFSLLLLANTNSRAQLPGPAMATRESVLKRVSEQAANDVTLDQQQLSVTELQKLIGSSADVVKLDMLDVYRHYQNEYSKLDKEKSWYKRFDKGSGIVGGLAVAVIIFLWGQIQAWVSKFFSWIGGVIYNRWAGRWILRSIGMKKYRRSLIAQNTEVKIPFRPNKPLKLREIFVPLKIHGQGIAEQLDAASTVLAKQFTVVLGDPGAGKSMLMRSLTLAAVDPLHSNARLPILIELSRLNEGFRKGEDVFSEIDLLSAISNVLSHNGFPAGTAFIKRGLEKGTFMLFFDGLDEVNAIKDKENSEKPNRREQVVQAIIRMYENSKIPSQIVVTCRTAVYEQQFLQKADQTLEIDEFTDWQIHRFLGSWQSEFVHPRTAQALLAALRDRPNIYLLAKNPLLLTIIAYLYADTEFVLPHSRAEFYQEAVTILLRTWKLDRNRFEAPTKRLILHQIALTNQRRDSDEHDRRSIDVQALLEVISAQLPTLHIPETEAMAVLEEIVQRSGILVPVDGGLKYQFAHLTLQEFFTAEALSNDASSLIERFMQDPTGWREVLLLWCGLDHDASQIIRALLQTDPVLALECIADARQITDAQAADYAVDSMVKRLLQGENLPDVTLRACALLAADRRPRGQKIFQKLKGAIQCDSNFQQSSPASVSIARVLSWTHLPEAAEALIKTHSHGDEIIRMGDLATAAIAADLDSDASIDQTAWSCYLLRSINTPAAAHVLVKILGHEVGITPRLQHIAASLGCMLRNSHIEKELANDSIRYNQRAPSFAWVWNPFLTKDTPIASIASRIVELLSKANDSTVSFKSATEVLDSRISIALVLGEKFEIAKNHCDETWFRKLFELVTNDKLNEAGGRVCSYESAIKLISDNWPELDQSKIRLNRDEFLLQLSAIFRGIYPVNWLNEQKLEIQHAWMTLLLRAAANDNANVPTSADWVSAFSPPPTPGRGWQGWLFTIGVTCVAIMSLISILRFNSSAENIWHIFAFPSCVGLLAAALTKNKKAVEYFLFFPLVNVCFVSVAATFVESSTGPMRFAGIMLMMSALTSFAVGCRLFCSRTDAGYLPRYVLFKAVLIGIGISSALIFASPWGWWSLDNTVQNPLQKVTTVSLLVGGIAGSLTGFKAVKGGIGQSLMPGLAGGLFVGIIAAALFTFVTLLIGSTALALHSLLPDKNITLMLCAYSLSYFAFGFVWSSWLRKLKASGNLLRPLARLIEQDHLTWLSSQKSQRSSILNFQRLFRNVSLEADVTVTDVR